MKTSIGILRYTERKLSGRIYFPQTGNVAFSYEEGKTFSALQLDFFSVIKPVGEFSFVVSNLAVY